MTLCQIIQSNIELQALDQGLQTRVWNETQTVPCRKRQLGSSSDSRNSAALGLPTATSVLLGKLSTPGSSSSNLKLLNPVYIFKLNETSKKNKHSSEYSSGSWSLPFLLSLPHFTLHHRHYTCKPLTTSPDFATYQLGVLMQVRKTLNVLVSSFVSRHMSTTSWSFY